MKTCARRALSLSTYGFTATAAAGLRGGASAPVCRPLPRDGRTRTAARREAHPRRARCRSSSFPGSRPRRRRAPAALPATQRRRVLRAPASTPSGTARVEPLAQLALHRGRPVQQPACCARICIGRAEASARSTASAGRRRRRSGGTGAPPLTVAMHPLGVLARGARPARWGRLAVLPLKEPRAAVRQLWPPRASRNSCCARSTRCPSRYTSSARDAHRALGRVVRRRRRRREARVDGAA